MTTSRAEERKDFTDPVRLRLVEADLDGADKTFRELQDELGKIKGILIGILVSTTTASILLAVNLGAGT